MRSKVPHLTMPLIAVLFGALSVSLQVSTATAQQVELDTSEGKIVIELNADKAPKSVANFLRYVESGHYEGTVFHRVMKEFMIQGGGMDESLKEKASLEPIENEGGNGLTNEQYTVAMARTNDPDSATCQFFINTVKNDFLNRDDPRSDGYGFAVFGKVVKGMDVVDKIENTKTAPKPNPAFPAMLMHNVPTTPVKIYSVRVSEQ